MVASNDKVYGGIGGTPQALRKWVFILNTINMLDGLGECIGCTAGGSPIPIGDLVLCRDITCIEKEPHATKVCAVFSGK